MNLFHIHSYISKYIRIPILSPSPNDFAHCILMVKIILYLSKTVTMLSLIIAPASNVAMSWSLIPIPFAMYLQAYHLCSQLSCPNILCQDSILCLYYHSPNHLSFSTLRCSEGNSLPFPGAVHCVEKMRYFTTYLRCVRVPLPLCNWACVIGWLQNSHVSQKLTVSLYSILSVKQ